MNSGYVKVWRSSVDAGLFRLPDFTCKLFFYMLCTAQWAPGTDRHGVVRLTRTDIRDSFGGGGNDKITKGFRCLIEQKMVKRTGPSIYKIINYGRYQSPQNPESLRPVGGQKLPVSGQKLPVSGLPIKEEEEEEEVQPSAVRKRDSFMDEMGRMWLAMEPDCAKPPYSLFGRWRSAYTEVLPLEVVRHLFGMNKQLDPGKGGDLIAYVSKTLAKEATRRTGTGQTAPNGKRIIDERGDTLILEDGTMMRKPRASSKPKARKATEQVDVSLPDLFAGDADEPA